MRVDFHVHTTAGQGENTPAEMAAVAKKRGLDAIAITDTNTTKGWKNFSPKSFVIIPGAKLATDKGDVLAFGMEKLPDTLVLEEVLEWAGDGNYLLVPAYFNHAKRNALGDRALQDFPVVEAINGTTPPWVCKDAVKKCTTAGVSFMCNSGARRVKEIGKFYNDVHVQTEDWRDIVRAVQEGEFEPRIKFPGLRDFLGAKFYSVTR